MPSAANERVLREADELARAITAGARADNAMLALESVLLRMRAWPTQWRPNVTDREDGVVHGVNLGANHERGTRLPRISAATRAAPNLARLVATAVRDSLPRTPAHPGGMPFSSVQINFNYASRPHVDSGNIGPSALRALGAHTGGELRAFAIDDVRDARSKTFDACDTWCIFDGRRTHSTAPFVGTRISLVAFTAYNYHRLRNKDARALRALGFTALPDGFGFDAAGLSAYRGTRSIASALTRELALSRANARHVVVESVGCARERGGARVHLGEKVVHISRNTPGLWLAPLNLRTRALGAYPTRFDTYQHKDTALAALARAVRSAWANHHAIAIVVADTAIAARRPFSRDERRALREATGVRLPGLAYREPLALVAARVSRHQVRQAVARASTLQALQMRVPFNDATLVFSRARARAVTSAPASAEPVDCAQQQRARAVC